MSRIVNRRFERVYDGLLLCDADRNITAGALTYTRSGAIYAPQQDGTLLSVAADTLPRAYDKVQGWHYRIDPSWVQSFTFTHALNNAAWTNTGLNATPTQTEIGPNGATDAWAVVENASNSTHSLSRNYAYVSGTWAVFLMVVAPSGTGAARNTRFSFSSSAFGGTTPSIGFNLATGAITIITNAGSISGSMTPLANGYWICTAFVLPTATATATYTAFIANGTSATYQGNGVSGIKIWCINAVASQYAVPLSLATSSAITIGTPTWTGTLAGLGVSLSAEYSLGADYFVTAQTATPLAIRNALQIDDGTANNRTLYRSNASSNSQGPLAVTSGTTVFSGNTSQADGARFRATVRFSGAASAAAINGSIGTPSGSITLPAGLSNVRIGGATTAANLAGGIKRAWISSTRGLTNTALGMLTK